MTDHEVLDIDDSKLAAHQWEAKVRKSGSYVWHCNACGEYTPLGEERPKGCDARELESLIYPILPNKK